MQKISVKFRCPKCGMPVKAKMEDQAYRFILYRCPKCDSNVVYYNNRTGIISNKLFRKLMRNNKIKSCGDIFSISRETPLDSIFPPKRTRPVSKDDITDLKILLAVENDSAKIISMI